MPEFLLELFCEEIPARLQRRAAEDLKSIVTNAMVENGLTYESAAGFVTPRRLALTITGVPARSPDTREERKGPRVGSPEKAVAGFLRGAGLSSVDDAQIVSDPKKGEFYVAVIEKPGATAQEIFAKILPATIEKFPWGKPMRWGRGKLQWVRPLRAITATFGTENDEPEVITFEVEGLKSGNIVFGHRFMAPEGIRVKRFSDYSDALTKAKVVLDLDRRMQIIEADTTQLAFAQGLTIVKDNALLEEVAGLVEWPVVMMGSFDEAYLELPEEVIIKTIKINQKCFCLRDGDTGKLANKFLLTANTEAKDGGKTIVAGNERVILARLSDAMFFYRNDLHTPLEDRLPKLEAAVFHKKLGSQRDRVTRIVSLATDIASKINADVDLTKRAALLAKADLVTDMVVEIPDLQGLMGRYYAIAQGEDASVADALEMHYKPVGPTDSVPTNRVAIAVSLADKLDLLTGFWSIDEKPTGSRDPFALRRAALGIIRILIENEISFELDVEPDLLAFFHDRLKVSLRDSGARHDLVDAVITTQSNDVLEVSRRVAALSTLLEGESGQSLLAGYRRGANILAAEEKKDGIAYSGSVDLALLQGDEEQELAACVIATKKEVANLVAINEYGVAMEELSALREPVDAFFEKVLVNDENADVRANRLTLLSQLRETMHLVADFSKIEG